MCSSRIGRVGIGLVGIEFVLAWLVVWLAGIEFVVVWLVGIGVVGIGLVGTEFVLAQQVGIGRAGIGFVLGWLVGTGRVGIDLVGIGLADDGKGRPAPCANAPLSTPGQVRSKETPAMLIATTIVIAKLHFQSLFRCNTWLTCQGHYRCSQSLKLGQ